MRPTPPRGEDRSALHAGHVRRQAAQGLAAPIDGSRSARPRGEDCVTAANALSLASLAVDFYVAEVVDLTQVVTGNIPKSLFRSR